MGRAVDLSPVSLERALALGRIQAAYQPIVALDSGTVIAEEALARWITRDGSAPVTP
jgi:sensor c-di-GMP phosphodiesterase-like protein